MGLELITSWNTPKQWFLVNQHRRLQKQIKKEATTVQWDILENPAQTFSFVLFLPLRSEIRCKKKPRGQDMNATSPETLECDSLEKEDLF